MATPKQPPPDDPVEGQDFSVPDPVAPDPMGNHDTMRLRRILAELAGRSMEALRLYEPLPVAQAFHEDPAPERIVIGSNRSGKTLAAAVEFARAVTNQDPFGRYPQGGRAIVVGMDGGHLADPIYTKLFAAGAFKIIRDIPSGQWRAYRPAEDRAREASARKAPALIPPRFIKSIAWFEKKRSIPKRVLLSTGWDVTFYSSLGYPPQGIDVDLWWFDEEIENVAWYPEVSARVLDRKGRGIWSATPQAGSRDLYQLHLRVLEGDPAVGEYLMLLADNPHIDDAEKEALAAKLTEEERRVRIHGEFAVAGFTVYPEFDKYVHGYELKGPLPRDWTRYVAVDPGRQTCACLFLAVPPPSVGKFVLIYDELYIKGCDAETFGKCMSEKMDGILPEAFLIDGHAGRVTEMGSGLNVEMQYARALKANRVRSVSTGYGFIWGADDVKAGITAVHSWLRIGPDGKPGLYFVRDRCPQFEREMSRYAYKKLNGQVSDEPLKKDDHLVDALRYLAMFAPPYRRPRRKKPPKGYAVRALEMKRRRKALREGQGEPGGAVRLGPPKRGNWP